MLAVDFFRDLSYLKLNDRAELGVQLVNLLPLETELFGPFFNLVMRHYFRCFVAFLKQ